MKVFADLYLICTRFSRLSCTVTIFSSTFDLLPSNTFSADKVGNPIVVSDLTLSQISPGFYMSAVQVLQKHCWKRRNIS